MHFRFFRFCVFFFFPTAFRDSFIPLTPQLLVVCFLTAGLNQSLFFIDWSRILLPHFCTLQFDPPPFDLSIILVFVLPSHRFLTTFFLPSLPFF